MGTAHSTCGVDKAAGEISKYIEIETIVLFFV